MTRGQHRAFRAARPVIPQHSRQQRLADAATPVRRVNVHVRAPGRPRCIHAAHAPDDVLSIERHILAERRVLSEQIARDRPGARHFPEPRGELRRADALDRHGRRRRWDRPSRCTNKPRSRAADSRAPCRQRVGSSGSPPRSSRRGRTALAPAVAQSHPPPRGRPRARSTPPCGNREDFCAAHPASPTSGRRGWPRRETCGSCRRRARARTPRWQTRYPGGDKSWRTEVSE